MESAGCRYSVVIPCYRSGRSLPELVNRLDLVLRQEAPELDYEILLVHDASPDETWGVIRELAEKFPRVRGLDLLYNVGQYRATLCGLAEARGEWLITLDDDLQHPPEELPKLFRGLEQHPEWDCVMGRFPRKRHSGWRNLGSRLMRWLNVQLLGAPPEITPSSFRVFRRVVAEALCGHGTSKPILSPLIFRTTRRIGNIDVEHHERRHGTSNYRLWQLVRILLDNVFTASTLPLRVMSGLGFFASMASVLLAGYYLLRYFAWRTEVKGFTTQVLLIIFFGGLTLFAIGLVGEYLSRVMDEVRRPPRYWIRERTE
jgi:polyisoprenyl-phosphate glycosyltransferase